jgi:protein SCO1/2
MTPPPRDKGNIAVKVVIALGIAILGVGLARSLVIDSSAPDLPVLATLPAFELTDQNGSPFGSQDLADHVWVATFIYSTCPGPCPRVVQKVRELDDQLTNDPRLKIVSFTVDPEVDTPEVLAEYAGSHGIQTERWKLLTGPSEEVFKLVRKGFLLGVSRSDTGDAPPSADGPVVHSVRLVLIDTAMNVRGYYDTTDPAAMARASTDIERLLAKTP